MKSPLQDPSCHRRDIEGKVSLPIIFPPARSVFTHSPAPAVSSCSSHLQPVCIGQCCAWLLCAPVCSAWALWAARAALVPQADLLPSGQTSPSAVVFACNRYIYIEGWSSFWVPFVFSILSRKVEGSCSFCNSIRSHSCLEMSLPRINLLIFLSC